MMKDVYITARTVTNCGMDEEDYIDFSSDGLYTYDGENGCLTYLESEVTGMEGTRTSVIIMPDQVAVDRDGLINSRMIFKEKERSSFLYNTPYGSATMNLSTRRISKYFDEKGGKLEIDYVLDVEHTVITRNKFQLRVTELSDMGGYSNG